MAEEKPIKSITYATAHVGCSNSPENVGKVLSNRMTKLDNDLKEINDRLSEAIKDRTDTKEVVAEKEVLKGKKDALQEQQGMYDKNPQLYSDLFAIQESLKKSEQDRVDENNPNSGVTKEPDAQSKIAEVNGEMCLAVRMQMEGSPVDFALRDGKITFPRSEVSPEQMKEIMDFLWRRGIRDFDLPKERDVDPKIADSFNKAKEKFDEERTEPQLDNVQGLANEGTENTTELTDEEAMLSPAERWERANRDNGNSEISAGEAGMAGNGNNGADGRASEGNETREKHESTWDKLKAVFGTPECQKKAEAHIEDMLVKGLHKTPEYSYFKRPGSYLLGHGGWTVYSCYGSDNRDNLKLDGKRDKKGNVNSTYEFRLYVRPNKKGNGVDVGYAMPKGKAVSEDVADEVLAIQKSQGHSHVNLKNIPNSDLGAFRKACGRALIVPVGIGLDRRKIRQMMEEAKERASDEEVLKYGYLLAEQMEKNALKKSKGEKTLAQMNESDAKYAAELKAAYEYTPFRNKYETVMRKGLEAEIKEGKAENVIAAARAVSKVYDLYEAADNEGKKLTWNTLMTEGKSPLSSKEIAALNNKISKLSKEERAKLTDTDMRNLSPKQTEMLYSAISEVGREQAKKDLDSAFVENNKLASGERENPNQIIRRMVSDAREEVSEVSNKLEDNGVKRLYVPNFKTPTYKFPERQQNNNNSNNLQPSARTGGR